MVAISFLFDALSFGLVNQYRTLFLTFEDGEFSPEPILYIQKAFLTIADVAKQAVIQF